MPPPDHRSPATGGNPSADQRIAKLLARAGVASRREVERMIAEGRVALNGTVILTPATVIPSLEGITVDGEPVEAPAPARLFLYHKPAGLLVTERDPGGRTTIYDRLPAELPRVMPVGRLDLGTEGLLLLTTDGELKRQLELPAVGVQRAYRARAYGEVTQQALEALIEGVTIEGVRYGSIDANLERRTGANVWIEMVLTEGKNREVRRVLEYLGLQVSRLIRTRYGPFGLGELPPGEVAEVRGHDIASFRKNPTRIDLPQPARQRGGREETVGPVTTPVTTRVIRGARPPKPGRDDDRRPREAPARPTRDGAVRPTRSTTTLGERRSPTERTAASPVRRAGHSTPPPTPRRPREEPLPGTSGNGRGAARKLARAAGPARGSPRPDRGAAPVEKPARAARARAFRETRDPGDTTAPQRPPRDVRPTRGPAGGRGAPR
ncbi:pseudouridine synthase, partial [Sphingomonas bacterium]|uniref:pseudouridine synthase n=1 Tax=Sphingomonas bacterium TaxID=1895847 RepID=UPI0020C68092